MVDMSPAVGKPKRHIFRLLAGAILCLGLAKMAGAQTHYPYSEWVNRLRYADSVSAFATKQP